VHHTAVEAGAGCAVETGEHPDEGPGAVVCDVWGGGRRSAERAPPGESGREPCTLPRRKSVALMIVLMLDKETSHYVYLSVYRVRKGRHPLPLPR
jgi:hypothetical protein